MEIIRWGILGCGRIARKFAADLAHVKDAKLIALGARKLESYGDDLLEIAGRKVSTMTADEVKSAMNAIPFGGLALRVQHKGGAVQTLTLKEGPIYPLYTQFGAIE